MPRKHPATYLMVIVSPAMKQHTQEQAQAKGISMSEFVRDAIAAQTGYDVRADSAIRGMGRPRIYQTDSEAREAERSKAREAAALQKYVTEHVMETLGAKDLTELRDMLESQGITVPPRVA